MSFTLWLLRRSTCWLVFGLLLSQRPVAAQNASARYRYWEAKPDSLRQVLATQHTDTARLRTLMHLADVAPAPWYWRAKTPTHVEVMAELVMLSKRYHRPEQRAYRSQASGNRLYQANAVAPALDSLQAAVAAFDQLRRPVPTLLAALRSPYAALHQYEAMARYFRTKLAYYQQRGPIENVAPCFLALGDCSLSQGDYNQALSYYLQEVALYRSFHRLAYYTQLSAVGSLYADWGNTAKALHYLQQAVAGLSQLGDPFFPYLAMARVDVRRHDYPAALRALDQALLPPAGWGLTPPATKKLSVLTLRSEVQLAQGHPQEAYPLLVAAQHLADSLGSGSWQGLDAPWARYYVAQGDAGRAEMHWLAAYRKARQGRTTPLRLAYLRELTRFYQPRQPAKAASYAVAALALADSLETKEGASHVARYEIEQADRAQTARITHLRQAQVQDAARARRQRWVLGAVLVVLALIGGFSFLLWRSNRRQQRANALLSQQKAEIQAQRDQTTQALTKLQVTQAQLIQAEKMASLGELTAGIAHEIQNPLNFVNNFSEVSAELVAELREERAKGAAADTELEEDLLTDLDQNLVKITEHGRRAAGIVRGMLDHSRTSSGERAPTDMNQLADEYLRLAYHGLRAKDKSFNAELQTDFAPGLPLVEGVGADLGRVLLNLFNNAFYAVQQRQQLGQADYAPTVSVQTERVGKRVQIHVRDNGTGMPESIKAKIFQPFFTTKPTGEGTGLGLSLSHDIIAQGHGGTLTVESREGEGTTFTITLPTA